MSRPINIWYRHEGGEAEVVDHAYSKQAAERLAGEYAMAYGVRPGDHRHGKDKLWVGRKKDEP